MKVVVHIAFYYRKDRLAYLEKIIEEYNTFSQQVDIFIHTNQKFQFRKQISYLNGNIKIIRHRLLNYIHYSGRYYYLTWQPRKLLKKQLQDYDIFIYSEDDILIQERTFNYWLRNKNSLIRNDANVGFLRVESKDGEDFLSDITSFFSSKVEVDNKDYVVNDINPYCAFWICDKDVLKKWIESDFYNLKKVHGYKERNSSLLRKLGLNNNERLSYLAYNKKNKRIDSAMEASAYGLNYPKLNWYKYTLIELENNKIIEDCKVYHLPNNYVNEDETEMGTVKFEDLY